MVLSPGAIVIILMLPLVGRMIGKMDARYMIAFGFAAAGIALLHMTRGQPGHGFQHHRDAAACTRWRAWRFCSCRFRRCATSAFRMEKNNNISGMINLARNMGGSIGIAGLETMLARRTQFHQTMLASHTSLGDSGFASSVAALTQDVYSNRIRRGDRGADGVRANVRDDAGTGVVARLYRHDLAVRAGVPGGGSAGVLDEEAVEGRRSGCGALAADERQSATLDTHPRRSSA